MRKYYRGSLLWQPKRIYFLFFHPDEEGWSAFICCRQTCLLHPARLSVSTSKAKQLATDNNPDILKIIQTVSPESQTKASQKILHRIMYSLQRLFIYLFNLFYGLKILKNWHCTQFALLALLLILQTSQQENQCFQGQSIWDFRMDDSSSE